MHLPREHSGQSLKYISFSDTPLLTELSVITLTEATIEEFFLYGVRFFGDRFFDWLSSRKLLTKLGIDIHEVEDLNICTFLSRFSSKSLRLLSIWYSDGRDSSDVNTLVGEITKASLKQTCPNADVDFHFEYQ
jgi:hypothetical protein